MWALCWAAPNAIQFLFLVTCPLWGGRKGTLASSFQALVHWNSVLLQTTVQRKTPIHYGSLIRFSQQQQKSPDKWISTSQKRDQFLVKFLTYSESSSHDSTLVAIFSSFTMGQCIVDFGFTKSFMSLVCSVPIQPPHFYWCCDTIGFPLQFSPNPIYPLRQPCPGTPPRPAVLLCFSQQFGFVI